MTLRVQRDEWRAEFIEWLTVALMDFTQQTRAYCALEAEERYKGLDIERLCHKPASVVAYRVLCDMAEAQQS